ncbi:hypothetical protein PENTCL1PPCAC_14485, partial [Pristionchus entomophagus]
KQEGEETKMNMVDHREKNFLKFCPSYSSCPLEYLCVSSWTVLRVPWPFCPPLPSSFLSSSSHCTRQEVQNSS